MKSIDNLIVDLQEGLKNDILEFNSHNAEVLYRVIDRDIDEAANKLMQELSRCERHMEYVKLDLPPSKQFVKEVLRDPTGDVSQAVVTLLGYRFLKDHLVKTLGKPDEKSDRWEYPSKEQ